MKVKEKLGLHELLALIKEGKNPAQISKKLKIPKQTLDYHVGKLKRLGCIEKKGYGTWEYLKEVPKRPKGTRTPQTSDLSKKEIRGHAFIWKIEFYNPFNWKQVTRDYRKKKLTFQKICRGTVFRTIMNNRKIWLTKKGLVIYEPLDFLGKSSFQVKGTAVYQMDKLIKDLLKELGQKIRPYRFTTSREHYALIRNELARQYNDKKKKMFIRNEAGTIWLWIDHSEGEHEIETNDPKLSRGVQNFWNDHKKHKFEVTPSFVLNTMQGIQTNQQNFNESMIYLDKNLKTHFGVLDKIGMAIDELRKEIKKKNEEKM